MKPYHNKVIFLPTYGSEDFSIGDLRLSVDSSYEPGKHQPITGRIMAVPDTLVYGKDDSQEWDVPMEVEIGDEAIVDFYGLYNAIEEGHTIRIAGNECVFLRYDTLLCARRGKDLIIPLNGYVLGEAIPPQDITKWENINKRKFKHDVRFSKVLHVGSRVNEYYSTKESDDFDPTVGDVVALDNFCDLPLENEDRHHFFSQKVFYFHRNNILGKLDIAL